MRNNQYSDARGYWIRWLGGRVSIGSVEWYAPHSWRMMPAYMGYMVGYQYP